MPEDRFNLRDKNGIKTDNRIENLQLLSKSEHTKIHHVLRKVVGGEEDA